MKNQECKREKERAIGGQEEEERKMLHSFGLQNVKALPFIRLREKPYINYKTR